MVAPDTSLSPTAFFLSRLLFLFLQTSPSPLSLGGCPGPAARLPLRLRWVLPAALAAAASLRPDYSGKRKLGGSRLAPRLSAPRLHGPRPRGQAPPFFPTPQRRGAARVSRGPLGGRFLSRPPPELLMVAARAPAL